MLKIAVCDDDAVQIQKVNAAIRQYISTHPEWQVEVQSFSSGIALLEYLNGTGGCDIALLDICMPGILGTDVAKEIRQRNDNTQIIFLTASTEYAVDAFALKAVHYLLKPIAQSQFDEAMDRALHAFSTGEAKKLAVRVGEGALHMVDLDNILYIESAAHDLTLYLTSGSLTESRRGLARLLDELETLSPGQFVSPYKGYILNLAAVRSIKPDRILLCTGTAIPLAKRNFAALRDQYMDYAFRGGD